MKVNQTCQIRVMQRLHLTDVLMLRMCCPRHMICIYFIGLRFPAPTPPFASSASLIKDTQCQHRQKGNKKLTILILGASSGNWPRSDHTAYNSGTARLGTHLFRTGAFDLATWSPEGTLHNTEIKCISNQEHKPDDSYLRAGATGHAVVLTPAQIKHIDVHACM